jgi:SAM-dependent methyltransferase
MQAVEFVSLARCDLPSAIELPPASSAVADRVASFLPALRTRPGRNAVAIPAGLCHLRFCFEQEQCPPIDYDRYGRSFTYGFFLENYWKAVSIFGQLQIWPAECVIDAGCGSGAASLAYLTVADCAAESDLNGGKRTIRVELLDRSPTQLRLARKIYQQVTAAFEHLRADLGCRNLDLADWEPQDSSADVVLFSHVLNENRHLVRALFEKAVRALRDGGRIYVIERPDDSVWEIIEEHQREMPLEARYGKAELPSGGLNLPADHPARSKAQIATSFLDLRLPRPKVLAQLLRLYFHAWQTQSLDLLEEVFAPHAEYHERPDRPPLVGLEAIRDYWRAKVLPQRDIRLTVQRFVYEGSRAFAEWQARFRLGDRHVQVDGRLALTVDPAARRVVALHECFRRQDLQE